MPDSAGQRAVQDATGSQSDVQELEKRFREYREARAVIEPEWFLNSAFYIGQQWLYWNRAGYLDLPAIPKNRKTPVDNRILPIVTARAARKVKNRPNFVATPFTGSEEDVEAAQVTEKVMQYDWVYLELQQKLFQAILFAEIVSAGFWKIYWDGTKGQSKDFLFQEDGTPLTHQETGMPIEQSHAEEILGGELPPELTAKSVAQGDVCVEVVSPFNFFPDPLATSMQECGSAFEEKLRSPEYVKERYGKDLEADTPVPVGPVESRLFGSLLATGNTGTYKAVKVYEYWEKPNPKFRNGRRVVWAKDQILEEDTSPLDPMPYVMFSGVKVPNRFWPTAITSQLRGPQAGLNLINQQVEENAKRLGNPALLASRQANVEYFGVAGERVSYDSTVTDAVPKYLVPPSMPQYVLQQREKYEQSLIEISGLHEVSNATVPAGVTAASAINLLQEADDTRIGPEIQDMEFALSQAGTKIVRLRANFNTDERILRIAGEDENWDILAFKNTMMGEEPTVECQAGSAMPRSQAAKQAAILEVLQTMFQYGAAPSPQALRKVFRDYEAGALDSLFVEIGNTEKQIQSENNALGRGEAVPINAYDEDNEHIAGHEEFQRTGKYRSLVAKDPEVGKLAEQHVAAHRERMIQATNAQIEAQQKAAAAEHGTAAAQSEQEHQQALDQQEHKAALNVAEAHAQPEPEAAPEAKP